MLTSTAQKRGLHDEEGESRKRQKMSGGWLYHFFNAHPLIQRSVLLIDLAAWQDFWSGFWGMGLEHFKAHHVEMCSVQVDSVAMDEELLNWIWGIVNMRRMETYMDGGGSRVYIRAKLLHHRSAGHRYSSFCFMFSSSPDWDYDTSGRSLPLYYFLSKCLAQGLPTAFQNNPNEMLFFDGNGVHLLTARWNGGQYRTFQGRTLVDQIGGWWTLPLFYTTTGRRFSLCKLHLPIIKGGVGRNTTGIANISLQNRSRWRSSRVRTYIFCWSTFHLTSTAWRQYASTSASHRSWFTRLLCPAQYICPWQLRCTCFPERPGTTCCQIRASCPQDGLGCARYCHVCGRLHTWLGIEDVLPCCAHHFVSQSASSLNW